MASKTLLVAQREYIENIRTKTFWIGIFIVPVLIAAAMGVGVGGMSLDGAPIAARQASSRPSALKPYTCSRASS